MNLSLRIDRDFDLQEFISISNGKASTKLNQKCHGICLDSRVLKKGDLFFALESSRDGHDFVSKAMQEGAAACVVSRDMHQENQILVNDTLKSLWDYAGYVRSQWSGKIVAISGSNGKTTTKEMVTTLLGEHVLKTPGTWNNHLGVPLTLLMLNSFYKTGVIEMGMSHKGELLDLCSFTKPDIAALTNVGPAHLQEFGSLDAIAQAKSEIFQKLTSKDIAILNIDDPRIEKMKTAAKIITVSQHKPASISLVAKKKSNKGYELEAKYREEQISVKFPMLGDHNISNYLCALGIARALNISAKDIQMRTPMIHQIEMRLEESRLSDGRILINDSYNANPNSLTAALQTVKEMKPRRLLVLIGDMLELGSESGKIHHDIAKTFPSFGISQVFAVGNFAENVAQGALEAGFGKNDVFAAEKKENILEKILSNFGPNDMLLVKGSRGMKLEEIVEVLQKKLKE